MNDNLHERKGPLLLLAGPGTGKTYRLGKRIKYLVEDRGVAPDTITVITFTSASAKNMRDRISNAKQPELYIDPLHQPKSIRTMHGLGYKILQDELARLKFECRNVVTSPELQRILCEDAAQLSGFERAEAKEVLECRRHGVCVPADQPKCVICREYKRLLRACSAIDYDDQILLACTVMKKHADLLNKFQAQCHHLLVDEYQDINAAQFELIQLLSEKHRHGLFVVGDDDQSIYSWRGGSPKFIRRFKDDFGREASVETLRVSFRCHEHVLEGSTSVLSKFDKSRIDKGTFTYADKVTKGPKIQVHSVASDEKEALGVRSIVQDALPSRDVLVLVPHRGHSVALCRTLAAAKIPYVAPPVMPGDGLPVIADLGNWLRCPSDALCFRLCLEHFLEGSRDVPSSRVRKAEKKQEREKLFQLVSGLWKPVLAKEAANLWDALMKSGKKPRILEQAHTTFSNMLAACRS
jgi:superfamily I DNA/RNA helicase